MSNRMVVFLVAFVASAAHEFLCVLWVHHSERNAVWGIAWTTALAAACTVAGVEGMLAAPAGAVGYVLGCAVGAVLGVVHKRPGASDT